MRMDDFEASGTRIGDDAKSLKDRYDLLIADVRPVLAGNRRPSTTKRWRACRRLADFVDGDEGFDVTNFSAACARDLGRNESLQDMISFGREFEEGEVFDHIPYTSYRTLIRKMDDLKRRGMFESEKARLTRARDGRTP